MNIEIEMITNIILIIFLLSLIFRDICIFTVSFTVQIPLSFIYFCFSTLSFFLLTLTCTVGSPFLFCILVSLISSQRQITFFLLEQGLPPSHMQAKQAHSVTELHPSQGILGFVSWYVHIATYTKQITEKLFQPSEHCIPRWQIRIFLEYFISTIVVCFVLYFRPGLSQVASNLQSFCFSPTKC